MPPVHVGYPIFILQIIKENVFFGVLAEDTEVVGFCAHPVEWLDEGVMRKWVDQLELLALYVKYVYFLWDGRSNAGGTIGIPLHTDPLKLIIINIETTHWFLRLSKVRDFQLCRWLHRQVVRIVWIELNVPNLCGLWIGIFSDECLGPVLVPLVYVVLEGRRDEKIHRTGVPLYIVDITYLKC